MKLRLSLHIVSPIVVIRWCFMRYVAVRYPDSKTTWFRGLFYPSKMCVIVGPAYEVTENCRFMLLTSLRALSVGV